MRTLKKTMNISLRYPLHELKKKKMFLTIILLNIFLFISIIYLGVTCLVLYFFFIVVYWTDNYYDLVTVEQKVLTFWRRHVAYSDNYGELQQKKKTFSMEFYAIS